MLLRAAFTVADPKSAKKTDDLTLLASGLNLIKLFDAYLGA